MEKQKKEKEEQLAYVEKIDSALKAWVEDGEKDGIKRVYLIVASEKTDRTDDEGNHIARSLISVTNRGATIQNALIAAMKECDDFRHIINSVSFTQITGIIKDVFMEGGKK